MSYSVRSSDFQPSSAALHEFPSAHFFFFVKLSQAQDGCFWVAFLERERKCNPFPNSRASHGDRVRMKITTRIARTIIAHTIFATVLFFL